MSFSQSTDEQLLKELTKGSFQAFELLYERYKGRLMGYFMFKVRRQEIAEDLFQLTWAKVANSAHRFEDGHKFSAWLMTIAANTLKDWFKKTSNQVRLMESYGSEPSLNHMVTTKEEFLTLDFLDEKAQKIMELKYVEGLTSKEISTVLGMKDSNVRKIVSRSLKVIKKHVLEGGSL